MIPSYYYTDQFIAYVRGHAAKHGVPSIEKTLLNKPICELTEEEKEYIFESGRIAGLKLYRFKNTHDELPRVKRVLGILKGIYFETLLDVGSGRGVFLFPFLEAFPGARVTSLDILDFRAEFLSEMSFGGIDRLTAICGDICSYPLADKSADVVTLLEVLEHIPDVENAVRAAVRIAKKFVIVSVPSREDDNPEHIHLLTKARLTDMFTKAGAVGLSFDSVGGHLIMIARVEDKLYDF